MAEEIIIKNKTREQEDKIPTSPREFHFEMPLYKEIVITGKNLEEIFTLLNFGSTIDAYCIYCRKESVFQNSERPRWSLYSFKIYTESATETYISTSYLCTRNDNHEYTSYFRVSKPGIQKIGQFPSIADLQIPQIQKYRKILGNEKYKEFVRAIGLIAHGVGIGSFVYLRRIFERLIEEAHTRASQVNSAFDEEAYQRGRTEEKILFLKNFLPKFLVENKSIYDILSKGIHELNEEECLDYFNPIKVGIELILDEKIRELDKKEKEKKASEAISKVTKEIKNK